MEQDVVVSFSSPQMSGNEVLKVLKQSKHLLWRAGYLCPSHD
ncbi:hypothetical protein JCM19240_3760 [Vibrio maritimus]|uniref:Cation transporter n=1 Tax=Vibrio maritimus TaxID=990268 RepID=A0A090T5Z2_9VIBR|nr:hypothetical protein JCM19240_3760 [Vibrio maritimus]